MKFRGRTYITHVHGETGKGKLVFRRIPIYLKGKHDKRRKKRVATGWCPIA